MGQLDAVSKILGELTAQVSALNEKVGALEAKVEELTGLRKMGIGIVIGLSAISAFLGGKVATILAAFK